MTERRLTAQEEGDRHNAIYRVVGKAVHPEAIRRLLELEPDAVVRVRHYIKRRPPRTVVEIFRKDPRYTDQTRVAWGLTVCHEDDQYDRKVGLKLAFDRALRKLPR